VRPCATTGTEPTTLVFDGSGNLWVSAKTAPAVDVYLSGAGNQLANALSGTQGVAAKGTLTSGNYNNLAVQALAFDNGGLFGLAATPVIDAYSSSSLTTAKGGGTGSVTSTLTDAAGAEPAGVGTDPSGNLYVSDFANSTVSVYTSSQATSALGGTAQTPTATLATEVDPFAVLFDSSLNTLYIGTQGSSNNIDVFWSSTVTAALAGTNGSRTGSLNLSGVPSQMLLIPAGDI